MLYAKKLSFGMSIVALSSYAQAIDIIKEGDTTLSVGGYIKAEGIFNNPENGESEFKANSRQSRINVTTTKKIEDKKLTGFIEGDFYGNAASGGSEMRLRHAYIKLDELTVGKTWNGQFLSVYPLLTEQLDFRGTALGTIAGSSSNIRPDLALHYEHKGFRFSAQDPVFKDADLPDIVVSYKNNLSNLSYNIAMTAREVENGEDSDIGVGVSLASKLDLGKNSFHASVYNGKGMGSYSTVCVGKHPDNTNSLSCDSENGKLISQTGYTLGYRHNFTNKLRSNIRYGEIKVDDLAHTSMNVKSANIIYEYLPRLDVGIEWRERVDKTASTEKTGQQVEIMAKYSF